MIYNLKLDHFSALSKAEDATFTAQNLSHALILMSDWESMLADPTFLEKYLKFLESEAEVEKNVNATKRRYTLKIHPDLFKLMGDSEALMYPQLLPTAFPSCLTLSGKPPYLLSEEK